MNILARCVLFVAVGVLGCSTPSPGTDAGADAAATGVDSGGGTDASGPGCTQDASEGAMCGNGVCDVTETCLTCVPDCACCASLTP
jgi:hypothetical protein